MSLRSRIALTGLAVRLGVAAGIGFVSLGASAPGFGTILIVLWLALGGPIVRLSILPQLFPTAICPGCQREIPLVARWKCGSHFTDHEERHILAFHCPQGHILEGFDCPRCRSTLLVQRGERPQLRHGSADRLRSQPAPLQAGFGDLIVGQNKRSQPVVIPRSRLDWHMAITGGTGRGKSTLLCHIARQLAEQGVGFTLLDPGGDLGQAVMRQIPAEREHCTLYLDTSNRGQPFPLNLLAATDAVERASLAEELLSVFQLLYADSWGPMLAHQLRMALRSVMETGGTLRDVYELFAEQGAGPRMAAAVNDPVLRSFWVHEFPTIAPVRRAAVTNKLAPIVFHPVLGPILAAQACIFDANRAIADRRITIVNLASGGASHEVTTLLGTFIVQKVVAAAFRQGSLPSDARTRHVLIVDEFQRFMHRAAAFDQILAEARKFKLSLVVANQFVEQLSDAVRAALFGNVGCLAAFRVGHRDARCLEPEFQGACTEELGELGVGECLIRIGTDWDWARTSSPAAEIADEPSARIVRQTQETIRRINEAHQQVALRDAANQPNIRNEPEFVQ